MPGPMVLAAPMCWPVTADFPGNGDQHLRDRWIPRLEQALAEVTLAIEEQELADTARLRLASGPGNRR